MKTIKLNYLAGALLLAAATTSCTKKLDQFPSDQIELSQSFQTVKDAKTWNNGMYSNLRARVYGIYTFSTDVQADELNASLDFGNRNGSPHRWDGFLSDDYTIRDTWFGYYTGINNLNIQIAGDQTIKTSTPAEATELARYIAEAKLARAYYYHQLILRWGKSYEPATAATDAGVPLVLKYDVNAQPARATVKQVYDQILADINDAKAGLASVAGAQGATKFNKDVAAALEARVRLYMQDWAGAKAAADAVIATNTYPLLNTQAALKQMWTNDLGTEVIFQSFVSKPNELANTNNIYLGLVASTGRFTPDFIPSQWVVDMYENTDIRKNVYFEQKNLTIQGGSYNNIWLVNKYPGNPALFTGATTNYQQAPKIFRVAELYLISAEASARLGQDGPALSRLNQLRTARGASTLLGLTGAALLQAIKDERTRELAFEGFRLDDLKRWHEGFTRKAPQNINTITTGSFYQSLSIAPDADKFTWGIPSNDITINPNLTQNKGW